MRVKMPFLRGMTKRGRRGETGTKLQTKLRVELRVWVRFRLKSKQQKAEKLTKRRKHAYKKGRLSVI